MYCLGGCPREEYRMVSHRTVLCRYPACHPVHRRAPCHSSPCRRGEYRRAGYRLPEALQDEYLTGSRTARMTRWRQLPAPVCSVPALMMQASMQQIAWKYFRNLRCSQRQKFPQ